MVGTITMISNRRIDKNREKLENIGAKVDFLVSTDANNTEQK